MESPRTQFDDRLAVKPEEAARMVGLSRTKFFEHLAKGEIRSFKDGRSRLIPVESLREWIAKQIGETAA